MFGFTQGKGNERKGEKERNENTSPYVCLNAKVKRKE
jgi:hypothetical protein